VLVAWDRTVHGKRWSHLLDSISSSRSVGGPVHKRRVACALTGVALQHECCCSSANLAADALTMLGKLSDTCIP